jgi:signal transduction histidine kinase
MKLAQLENPPGECRGDGIPQSVALVRDPGSTTDLPDGADDELEAARHLCQTLLAERNQLRERLGKAHARIEAAEREAAENTRSNDQLVSCMAQELRTPLQSMALNVEMAIRRHLDTADGVPPAWVVERLRHMRSAVHRLHRLCDTFVSTAALDCGELRPHLEAVDLRQVLVHVADRMADDLAWAGCELSISADQPQVGQWDRLHVDHIVAGLLDSAMRHGAGRPIAVALRPVAAGDDEPTHVELEVRDAGRCLPGQDLEHIFDPHARAEDLPRDPGFGLGLWLVRKLAAGMGGTACARAGQASGTVLTVRLPLPPP